MTLRGLLGRSAEQQAERFLNDQGLTTLARNVSFRHGEIDLLMRHDDAVVVVEVRYRERADYGGAAASVTPAKRRRLIAAAGSAMADRPELAESPWRFDVVAVEGGKTPTCNWIQDAFQPESF